MCTFIITNIQKELEASVEYKMDPLKLIESNMNEICLMEKLSFQFVLFILCISLVILTRFKGGKLHV